MPLARLSIRSAINVAMNSVTLHHHRADYWRVRLCIERGSVTETGPLLRDAAKARRRSLRIFAALTILGVDEAEARQVAENNDEVATWDSVVGSHMERRSLRG